VHETEPEVTCREFVELATDYLDEALPPLTVDLVEEHLVFCDWCRDYLDGFEATVAAVPAAAHVHDHEERPDGEMLRALLGAFRETTARGAR